MPRSPTRRNGRPHRRPIQAHAWMCQATWRFRCVRGVCVSPTPTQFTSPSHPLSLIPFLSPPFSLSISLSPPPPPLLSHPAQIVSDSDDGVGSVLQTSRTDGGAASAAAPISEALTNVLVAGAREKRVYVFVQPDASDPAVRCHCIKCDSEEKARCSVFPRENLVHGRSQSYHTPVAGLDANITCV
jgi:hypothetical protein